jgi:hypothetical protein
MFWMGENDMIDFGWVGEQNSLIVVVIVYAEKYLYLQNQ